MSKIVTEKGGKVDIVENSSRFDCFAVSELPTYLADIYDGYMI